jgi:pyochelin biosynthesis protein PchG
MTPPASPSPRVRVGVCGTTFGQVYLEALRDPALPFELTAILGRGSARSQACAAHYGAPLLADLDRFAERVDVACVVVRSGLLGGRGTELAQALMERGVHVLQEHPVHHDELADCLRCARRSSVAYRLSSFYLHLEPVRRFVAATRELARRQPPLYVDAACGLQVAFALPDILGACLGGVRPWALADAPTPARMHAISEVRPAFRSLDGVIGGIPLSLRVQHQLDPADPDNFVHLLHRITLGTEGGNLTLLTTHGPIVWSARPEIPSHVRDPAAAPLYGGAPAWTDDPSCVTLGPPDAPSWRTVFTLLWPQAAGAALAELRRAALAGSDPLEHGGRQLALCKFWQDVAARLGPPDLIRPGPVHALGADGLAAVEAVAE